MRYASAFSVHPDAGVAAGEAIGSLLDQLPNPTTVVVMVSGEASWRLADFVEAADALLSPDVLVGVTSMAVRGNGSPLSKHALAIWACDGDGVRSVRLEADAEDPDEFVLTVGDQLAAGDHPAGGGHSVLRPDERLLLFCDPESIDADALVAWRPDVELSAGFLEGIHTGGLHRLFIGQDEYDDGAVGLAISSAFADVILDRGVRRVGDYWTVTGVDRDHPRSGVMLGGVSIAERAAEVGLRSGQVVLGSVTLDPDGDPIFVAPCVGIDEMDLVVPSVGELCCLWAYDPQVFGAELVNGVDWLSTTTHLGFGPQHHLLDPEGMMDGVAATARHQIGSFCGVRTIFTDAFAAVVLR